MGLEPDVNPKSSPSEKQQENLLKNTAITLNLESISKDLQFLLQTKIFFVCKSMEYISNVFVSLSNSQLKEGKIEEILSKSKVDINKCFKHIQEECANTDNMLNMLLKQSINKAMDLKDELSQNTEGV